MKKIIIIMSVIVAIALWYYFYTQWPQRSELVFAGNYGSYEQNSGMIKSDKITVLDFYASRCPSCRASHKKILDEVLTLPSNIQVLNVDYDNSEDLRKKYEVTSQHTFVLVDRDGNMIKKTQWLMGVNDIINFVWDYSHLSSEDIQANIDQVNKSSSWTNETELEKADMKKTLPTQTPWVYMDYESGKSMIGQSDKKVALFFHAERCPACRLAEKNIITNKDTIDSNIVLLKVDYDTASELKQKYGITSQTSYVLLNSDGTLNKKIVGLTTLEEIEQFVK